MVMSTVRENPHTNMMRNGVAKAKRLLLTYSKVVQAQSHSLGRIRGTGLL